MAKYPSWDQLNKRQRKLALERWHARNGESQPQTPPPPAADRNPLYDPTQTLSGQQLKTAVNEVVAGQFRPVEKALARQATSATRQNSALASRVAGYSDTLDKRADVTTARQQAIAEQLNNALAAIGQQAQGTADTVQAEEGLRRDAEVALRAAPAGSPDPVAEEIAAMRARAAAGTKATGTLGAVTGANYAGLSNANREALLLRGQEQQGQIANSLANDLAEIRAKQAELGQAKGAERTKQLLGLRQSGFENLITTQGLGLKTAELQADIENQRKQLALARARRRDDKAADAFNQADRSADNAREDAKLADTQARDDYQREHGLGPYKPASEKSPAQESADARKLKTGVENAAADFKQLLGSKDKNGNSRSVDRVQEILRRRGAPPIVILAAADIAQFGFVRPQHLKSLRIAGVNIPKSWRAPKVKPSQSALDHPRG